MPEKLRSAAVVGLRFLFLTRYSWLLALVLVALPPFSLSVAPALLENLFVLDHPGQMLHVSWIAMFCAASVIGTLRITTLNAVDRFDDYRQACDVFDAAWETRRTDDVPWYDRWEGWLTLLAGLAAAIGIWYVIIAACVARTAEDPGPGWGGFADASEAAVVVTKVAWGQALAGGAFTLGLLAAVYGLQAVHKIWFAEETESNCPFHFGHPRPGEQPAERLAPAVDESDRIGVRFYRFLAWLLGPGYFREVIFRRELGTKYRIILAPGHASLLTSTILFLGWYAWNYWSVLRNGVMPDENSAICALSFGLLSLLLVILILPGISFLLDRHRIPILPTLLLVMATFYSIFTTDHYYDLNPGPVRSESIAVQTLPDVYNKWQFPLGVDGHRTLVVVDASGGGIQASAWTAQVLTGLHDLYGNPFSRSVGLISAVSGGSVGTMFYLANRAEAREDFNPTVTETVLSPEAVARIREASRASGLEASCWGIAFPDTLRALFPPLAGRTIDRGWAIEQLWRARMDLAGRDRGDLRLSELGTWAARRQLPVAVFNATLVESGERLLISPVAGPEKVGTANRTGYEFLQEFPDSHLRVSTAARLSATFPYVTPVSKPLEDPATPEQTRSRTSPLAAMHVADGAYADNEGVVTSVDWLNRLLVYYSRPENLEQRPFDRVLLLRIQAFPRKQTRRQASQGSLAGWQAALLGPFQAMMQVRSASQTERGDLEINLLTRATLAELRASRERAEREFQSALAQVEQLDAIRHELYQLLDSTRNSSPDAARKFLEIEDEFRAAQEMLRQAQESSRKIDDLQVESVVFDFQPVEQVRVPMSWKLTDRQKRQLDRAWQELVAGRRVDQPLSVLDKYFARISPAPIQSLGNHDQSNRPRASSGQISTSRP